MPGWATRAAQKKQAYRAVWLAALLLLPISARAETPDEWVALGARVHGGFGAFIPLGIKIGWTR
jgi:hypothetical protein